MGRPHTPCPPLPHCSATAFAHAFRVKRRRGRELPDEESTPDGRWPDEDRMDLPPQSPTRDPLMLSILIVDDHEIVRHGIRHLVSLHSGWEICAEASDGKTGYELALALKPNIVILDI